MTIVGIYDEEPTDSERPPPVWKGKIVEVDGRAVHVVTGGVTLIALLPEDS